MSSEEVVQQQVRMMIGAAGMTPMRNNVGACQDATGRLIRYGLMNDTHELNQNFKSSDLIIARPMLITQEWVGHVVGVFSAVECKESGWKLRPGDKHGQAQKRFIDLVRAAGGFAGFARSVQEARQILRLPT